MSATEETARPKPPLACYWSEEPDGTRWLVPGCVARLHDVDAEACTCPTLADQLETARRERDEARHAHQSLKAWNDAIVAAVYAHPDGTGIMKNAADGSSGC
ncbi:hypothetical protein ACIGN6_32065 [Streptomyces sp. NPDC053792]|uniref:hypothetical protein n=1 Tax=Streptomyces sp. NPDC053792 TaxID=3365716 RepID=UPI0037CEECE1